MPRLQAVCVLAAVVLVARARVPFCVCVYRGPVSSTECAFMSLTHGSSGRVTPAKLRTAGPEFTLSAACHARLLIVDCGSC